MKDEIPDAGPARLRKRTVTVSGHVTSVSLEEAFWEVLKDIARRRDISINALVSEIDAGRRGNLSSALRVHALADARQSLPGADRRQISSVSE